jgi:defect in organelle trafficking protein DotC
MRYIFLLIALSFLLAGCGHAPMCVQTTSLAGLQGLCGQTNTCGTGCRRRGLNHIRIAALRETALSLGAQSALALRCRQINADLNKQAKTLDRAFNFNAMILPHNVLPPVLQESNASLNLADDNTIRLADKTYKIVCQARFVTTPPTWRTYLCLNYTDAETPNPGLLPRSAQERAIWRQYVAIGWHNGIDQANTIYLEKISLLKRDFVGMVLYRKLLAQHIVSPPYVSHTDLGVTGDGDNLRVNDQILRITALPTLQTNPKIWRPVIENP